MSGTSRKRKVSEGGEGENSGFSEIVAKPATGVGFITREGGNIGLFITIAPKVLYQRLFR